MTDTAARHYETWPIVMGAMRARAPEIPKAFGPFFQAMMREGALSAKHKELIALAIGVATHCEPCIYAHAEKCLKAGATPEEMMEAAGVAVMMGGGPAYTHVGVLSAAIEHLQPAAR